MVTVNPSRPSLKRKCFRVRYAVITFATLAMGTACSCGLAAGAPSPSTSAACPRGGHLTADSDGVAAAP
jgi:hypothetical protein